MTAIIATVMNQLSCEASASLALVTSGVASWPKGFGCSSPPARVTSEWSLAAVSVRCIGAERIGPLLGVRCANPTGLCRGSSRDGLTLDRSGAGDNGWGDDDGEFERRGGSPSMSGSLPSRGPGCNTQLAVSFPPMFLFFEYSLLCVPAAASSYRWE